MSVKTQIKFQNEIKKLENESNRITDVIDAHETAKEKIQKHRKSILKDKNVNGVCDDEIKKMLDEELGNRIKRESKRLKEDTTILESIKSSKLPYFVKWEIPSGYPTPTTKIKHIYQIRIKNGRVETDRIKFEDNGRMEYDTQNNYIVVDSDYKPATQDEWADAIFKLMDYING